MFSLQIDRYGYPYVQIRVGGKQKFHFVHRLVALHFLGHSDTLEVNHIDLNKTNNNVENLEWCTRVENLEHAKLNGRRKIGLPRLTMAIADDLRNDRRSGMTYKSLGLKYGVDASLACRIVKGERWAK